MFQRRKKRILPFISVRRSVRVMEDHYYVFSYNIVGLLMIRVGVTGQVCRRPRLPVAHGGPYESRTWRKWSYQKRSVPASVSEFKRKCYSIHRCVTRLDGGRRLELFRGGRIRLIRLRSLMIAKTITSF